MQFKLGQRVFKLSCSFKQGTRILPILSVPEQDFHSISYRYIYFNFFKWRSAARHTPRNARPIFKIQILFWPAFEPPSSRQRRFVTWAKFGKGIRRSSKDDTGAGNGIDVGIDDVEICVQSMILAKYHCMRTEEFATRTGESAMMKEGSKKIYTFTPTPAILRITMITIPMTTSRRKNMIHLSVASPRARSLITCLAFFMLK